jgi:hypothetical protein
MLPNSFFSKLSRPERTIYVLVAAIFLFLVSFLCEEILLWRGVHAAQTLLDDVAIGLAGGFIVWALLSLQARHEEMVRTHELMRLNAQLNHHIRNAHTILGNAILVEKKDDRLRLMDVAMQRVDHPLNDLVPMAGTLNEPRFFN